ncbi:MAG TPA: serine/threonine-protein kinase, partial [Nocardioides sp.]
MSDVFPQTGEQFGRYRIDRQIGFGGMGVVYAATDTTFGRSVALKVISARLAGSDEFRRRFHREAAILARLDSPHVITIFDHAEHDGTPYISTQLIGGGDVGELLRRGGPLPAAVACRIAAQVADALHDAHRAGVVHRDVKPGNVLLRDGDLANPHAYLCDFGIAQADSAGFTLTGSVSGTWAYLAPERGRGGPGTPSSDIYALGCLLWAMLVGTTPYVGSDLEVALAHQQAPVPQLAGHDTFTAGLNAVLARSMAKDPTQRYPTAAAMRGDLARLGPPSAPVSPATAVTTAGGLSSLPSNRPQTRTGAGTSPSTAPARRNRRRGTAVAGVLALIIAASGVTWALSTTPWRDQGRTTDQSVRDADAPPRASGGAPGTSDFDGDGLGDVLASYWSPTDESGVEPTTQLFLHHSDGTKLDMEPTRAGASDSSSRLPTLGPGGQLLVGNFDDDPQAEPYLVRESAERNGIIEFIPANDSGVEFALRLPADTFFLGAHAGDFTGDGATDIALAYGGTSGDFRMHDGAGKIAVWTNLDLDREDDPPHFMPPEDGSGAPDVWLSAE